MASTSTTTQDIVDKWVARWSGEDASPWVSLYSTRAKYTDHAFLIVRIGRETLKQHWEIWHASIPDFVMEATSIWPEESLPDGKTRVTLRTKNSGTLLHDLPSKKASGKPFSFAGVVDLVIDKKSGLIEKVDEWYSYKFDLASSEGDYHHKADEDSANPTSSSL